jgi:hypothetical protein
MFTVCVQTPDGKTKKIDLVNIVDINASIGKSNLMKEEVTQLSVQVTGLEGCPYRPVQLELSNKTTSVIHLEKGDQQIFPVDQWNDPQATITHQPYQTTQNVIGQTVGEFVINTTLHVPPSAYANTMQAYLDNITNPLNFNMSLNALKNDISHYIASPDADKNVVNYLQQVRNKLPVSNSASSLSQSKALTSNLLNPLSSMPGAKDFFSQLSDLNKLHPDIAAQAQVQQFVHPLHDLAGEFNSATKVLNINPADKDALLKYLGAKKMENGNYSFTLSDGTKPVLYTDVHVDPNEPAGACDGGMEPLPGPSVKQDPKAGPIPKDTPGSKAETKGAPQAGAGDGAKTPGGSKAEEAGTKGEPKNDAPPTTTSKDSTKPKSSFEWPENGTSFRDSSGRKYEFFKNAECKLLYTTPNTDCQPNLAYSKNETTGKYDGKPTGKYDKWIFQPVKRCVKGNGFCTEMEQISATQMIYEDKDCQRLVEVKTYNHTTCP